VQCKKIPEKSARDKKRPIGLITLGQRAAYCRHTAQAPQQALDIA